MGHDHPSEPNIWVYCPLAGENRKTIEGAAQKDLEFVQSLNNPNAKDTLIRERNHQYAAKGWLPMTFYIVDKHSSYRQRPGESLGMELKGTNRVRHDRGNCAWPKRRYSL
jgi:hypothetical protein